MVHPFTRFDFKFGEHKVAAEYEDIDGILHFFFKIDESTIFFAQISQSPIDYFVEIDRLHYGEAWDIEHPKSSWKGSGFPAACIDQLMRKHPELRFAIRERSANDAALRLAQSLARAHPNFVIL